MKPSEAMDWTIQERIGKPAALSSAIKRSHMHWMLAALMLAAAWILALHVKLGRRHARPMPGFP